MSIISFRDDNTFVEFSDDDIMTLLIGDTFSMVPNAFWELPTLSGRYRHFLGVNFTTHSPYSAITQRLIVMSSAWYPGVY